MDIEELLKNRKVIEKLKKLYKEREGRENEVIGCITAKGDVILLAEHSNWSKLYGCKPYDIECVKKIREDLKLKGCIATFHLHTPEGALLEPSGHDILTVYLLDLPDVIVHRDGLCVYRPLKKDVGIKDVWDIDEKCWVESDEDYWAWKACLNLKLPIEKKVFKL